jgi:hypothetical protein
MMSAALLALYAPSGGVGSWPEIEAVATMLPFAAASSGCAALASSQVARVLIAN